MQININTNKKVKPFQNFNIFQTCKQNINHQTTVIEDLRPNKISLKKILEGESTPHRPQLKFKKSISHTILESNKSHPNKFMGFQKETKESQLFKKKIKIQHEIHTVHLQMNQLNKKYDCKINMLRKIKKQLGNLRNQ